MIQALRKFHGLVNGTADERLFGSDQQAGMDEECGVS